MTFVLRSGPSSLAVSPKGLLEGFSSSSVKLGLLSWQVCRGCCDQLTVEFIFISCLIGREQLKAV